MQGSVKASEIRTGQSWWPTAIAGLVLFGLIGLLYGETAANMIAVWDGNSTYNYAYLIPLISGYLIYSQRRQFTEILPRLDWLAIPYALPFSILWLVADAADVSFARQFALIGLVQAVLLAVLGRRLFLAMLFPIQYLWLVLPMWDFLVAPLQRITLELSAPMVDAMAIPTYVEGLLIEVPTGLYRVAPECSGLNFLLASAALSALYGYLMYRGIRKQVLCVVISLLAAILANGVRVAVIIGFNHYGGSQIGIGGDHLTWGWGFFAVVVLLMMWLGSLFRDGFAEEDTPEGMNSENRLKTLIGIRQSRGIQAAIVAGVILVSAGPPLYAGYLKQDLENARQVVLVLPDRLAKMIDAAPDTAWSPQFPAADWTGRKAYKGPAGNVDLYLAYYAVQGPGKEVISFENIFYDRELGKIAGDRPVAITVDGAEIQAVESRIATAKGPRLVWSWYWIDGRYVARNAVAKLLQAKVNLLNGDRRAAFVAISVPLDVELSKARSRLQNIFMGNLSLTTLLNDAEITEKIE